MFLYLVSFIENKNINYNKKNTFKRILNFFHL
jgi:hypothetical protein